MDAWDPDPANSRFITKVNRRKTWLIIGSVVGIILFIAGLTTLIVLLVNDSDKTSTTSFQSTTVPYTATTQTEKLIIAFNLGYQDSPNSFGEVRF